jgi:hypothetical protein
MIVQQYHGVLSAVREESLDNAEREGLSGFKKVRSVCARVLGVQPLFEIPQPTERKREYTVELKFSGIFCKVMADDSCTYR